MPKPYKPRVSRKASELYGRLFNPDCNQLVEGTTQGPTAAEVAEDQTEIWAERQREDSRYRLMRDIEAQKLNQSG